jgi:hypothetical protein
MERMVDRYLREEALAFMPLLLGWEIHGNNSGCFSRYRRGF